MEKNKTYRVRMYTVDVIDHIYPEIWLGDTENVHMLDPFEARELAKLLNEAADLILSRSDAPMLGGSKSLLTEHK